MFITERSEIKSLLHLRRCLINLILFLVLGLISWDKVELMFPINLGGNKCSAQEYGEKFQLKLGEIPPGEVFLLN